jgi:hypothetical protein
MVLMLRCMTRVITFRRVIARPTKQLNDARADAVRFGGACIVVESRYISWAGFISSGELLHTPFPEESRVVGTSSIDGDDVALRGEWRFFSPSALTAQQNTILDSVLQAHNSATLTEEQVRQGQDTTDLNALLATDIAVYRNHLTTWDAKTTANKLVASKEMFTIIGKVLRIFIRRNADGGGAI